MYTKNNKLFISIALAPVLIGIGWSAWLLYNWHQSHRASPPHYSNTLGSVQGWKISRMVGGKKLYNASIESFSIERAQLGPFAIGPLHVLHLKNAILDFYAEGLAPLERENRHSEQLGTTLIKALESSFTDIKNEPVFRSRKIRILDVAGVGLNLWEKEKKVFAISSDKATIDRATGDLIFVGHVVLDARENGTLISYRIRWIKQTSLFRIDDAFILTRGKNRREGRGLETDYLLNKISYQNKK
jgi:hypothetical protein